MEMVEGRDGVHWLMVDGLQNAIDNLEMFDHFLGTKKVNKWKWAAIAAHQALYGFLLCALSGSSGEYSVLDLRKDSSKAIRLLIEGLPADKIAAAFGVEEKTLGEWSMHPYVISIHEALKRMENSQVPRSLDFRYLKRTDAQRASTERLINEVRNEFEHFVPRSLVFEVSEFAPLLWNTAEVIRFVALESNGVYIDSRSRRRIASALARIEKKLTSDE